MSDIELVFRLIGMAVLSCSIGFSIGIYVSRPIKKTEQERKQ